jgi:hypothetical protein
MAVAGLPRDADQLDSWVAGFDPGRVPCLLGPMVMEACHRLATTHQPKGTSGTVQKPAIKDPVTQLFVAYISLMSHRWYEFIYEQQHI